MFFDEPDLVTAAPAIHDGQTAEHASRHPVTHTAGRTEMHYAPFADRAFAGVVDAMFLSLVETISICALNLVLNNTWTVLTHALLPCLVSFLYYPLLECSGWQATIGKRCFGLTVTDIDGGKLSLLRAFLKQSLQALTGTISFAGIFLLCSAIVTYSTLDPTTTFFVGIFIANILYFGMHCVIVFTQKKQSVFDKVTGRLVYKRRQRVIQD